MNANELIKQRRKELNLTQKEVANCVGVSEATVSRWESGDIANMGRDKIALLSKVLNISPSIIAGYDEDISSYSDDELDKEIVKKYETLEEKDQVIFDREELEKMNVKIIEDDLIKYENQVIRHNTLKLAFYIFSELIKD